MSIRKKIVKVFKYKQVKKGEILFSKGDEGDCAYMILEGRVGIYANPASLEMRKEILKVICRINGCSLLDLQFS